MNVKHNIKLDLTRQNVIPRVDMVHGDQYARQLELELYCGAQAWPVPEDAHALIRFQRTDGTGGKYDYAPEGRRAWSIKGNCLTVDIAPQVLESAGTVKLAVDILQGDARVSTFDMVLNVCKSIPRDLIAGEDYPVNAFLTVPENAQVGQYLRVAGVSDYGCVTEVEAFSPPSLQEAVNLALSQAKQSGDFDGPSAYEVALENGFQGTQEEWLESLQGEDCRFANTSELGDVQQINITGKLTSDSSVNINFKGSRIQGVKPPVNGTDAANKDYVDRVSGKFLVPGQWQSAVDAAAERISAHQDAGGKDCVSFAWFSDSHIRSEGGRYTGDLAAAVMEKCRIPFAVFCGDATVEDAADESAMGESMEAAERIFAPIGRERLLRAQGCCDGSYGADNAWQLDANKLYGAIFRSQAEDTRRVFGGDGSYFYVDYPAAKVRFIILNSSWVLDETDETGAAVNPRISNPGFGNDQLNWLANTALKFTQEGWMVVLAGHILPNAASLRDGAVLRGILSAFSKKTSYSGTSGTAGTWKHVSVSCNYASAVTAQIAGYFAGYDHQDRIITSGVDYPMVCITSDADLSLDENEEDRVSGTDNDHAIDFVTINRHSGTVYLTRLGAGADRSFSL